MLIGGLIVAVISMVVTMIGIPRFIMFFHKKKLGGQPTLEEVKQHASKAGTPTMGGLVFVVVTLFVSLVAAIVLDILSPLFIIAWWVLAMYAVIGFFDDFLKIFKKVNQGLTAVQKLLAQILIGVVSYVIYTAAPHFKGLPPARGMSPDQGMNPNHIQMFNWDFNLGIFFLIFIIIWLVGWSNAVNLTDGIDGLASITVAISLIAYAIIAVAQHHYDVLVIIMAMVGGLLGFFVFNHKPAKIFMGDVGSLALGGFLAIISILLHAEWTLVFIGAIYIIETLSVMIQVTYFKKTGGKRIFRMTPIHHHFELGGFSGHSAGWSEWKIDLVFWTVTAVLSALALGIYFLV
ncbi:phospho-N-acetylmuramoyl-pentapeptide-transferase [Lactococcus fujiensis]|uniref:Phospho-N-acetylmuramoyl-pentapeptide-transferase n=1 Tax=Lactococcus fujiensis JCM 16395 TaxID=1291764 RepID=A0A2A5RIW1_9LACT|nr:phospho-N-acetylmuramoyl-pentapeptide-transferase [Lactococcus fujiensis]PCR99029.1 phospho-N-acetylmuramoyl-pentapeptide-transferase [Lactococcus fujiensis JCM 16395]